MDAAPVMTGPSALALSPEESKSQKKNKTTEVLVKGIIERADNCEFVCPFECCDSTTNTTAQLNKHIKGCKYNLCPSAQLTFEIECFKCEVPIYTGELRRLRAHAGKCKEPLPVHKHINLPTCLTCNRFFFLEAALLKHIKLEHPPTSPQVKEDKNKTRVVNLNCGSYTESGETLRVPCPVVGCPRNTVCYKNLRLLTDHIKKEHTKNLTLSARCSKCNINITSHNLLKVSHHFVNCKGVAFPFLSTEVPSPSRIRPIRPGNQPSSTATSTTTTPPQTTASPTTSVATSPTSVTELPTLIETTSNETPTQSTSQTPSPQLEKPEEAAEPQINRDRAVRESEPEAAKADVSQLQKHVSRRLNCAVAAV